jgi:hypothetical protein
VGVADAVVISIYEAPPVICKSLIVAKTTDGLIKNRSNIKIKFMFFTCPEEHRE